MTYGEIVPPSVEEDKQAYIEAANTPEAVLIEAMRRVKIVFDSWKQPWWLEGGTLLGIVREGHLLKKEAQNFSTFASIDPGIIGAHLTRWGFDILSICHNPDDETFDGWNLNVKFYTAWISINFCGYKKPNLWYHAFKRTGTAPILFELPERFFQKFESVDFGGVQFPAPYPKEEYLEYRYGKDWRTPLDQEGWEKIANDMPALANSPVDYGRLH